MLYATSVTYMFCRLYKWFYILYFSDILLFKILILPGSNDTINKFHSRCVNKIIYVTNLFNHKTNKLVMSEVWSKECHYRTLTINSNYRIGKLTR